LLWRDFSLRSNNPQEDYKKNYRLYLERSKISYSVKEVKKWKHDIEIMDNFIKKDIINFQIIHYRFKLKTKFDHLIVYHYLQWFLSLPNYLKIYVVNKYETLLQTIKNNLIILDNTLSQEQGINLAIHLLTNKNFNPLHFLKMSYNHSLLNELVTFKDRPIKALNLRQYTFYPI